MVDAISSTFRRLPFLVPGILALLAGMWGGLLRVPLNLPLPVDHAQWITHHGALMVCGFLGTLIGVERAVGHGALWTWLAPLLTGTGAILCVLGFDSRWVLEFFLAGSVCFAAVTIQTSLRHREFFTVLMAVAAMAWTIGNAFLLAGWPVGFVVWWWAAFLGWTILAERLELTRLLKVPRYARPLLVGTLALQLTGMLTSLHSVLWGERLIGLAFILQAVWLIRFDLARKNVRLTGLPRFAAVCLLIGYGWLAVAGAVLIGSTPLQFGASYDAVLHAFFLGFVFAMIFGHAPIIFPAVLNLPITFAPRFYFHVALLAVSLIVRVLADLVGWSEVRAWAAVGNAAAILSFIVNIATSVVVSLIKRRNSGLQLTGIKKFIPNSSDEVIGREHDVDQSLALWFGHTTNVAGKGRGSRFQPVHPTTKN